MGSKHKNKRQVFNPADKKRFGRLVLTGETDFRHLVGGTRKRLVEAVCDCGVIKYYLWNTITRGDVVSCGCYRREATSIAFKTHGLTKHPLYIIYNEMKQRCFYKEHKHYKDYGGRGIFVCKEWVDDFVPFFNWCNENGWIKGLDIDRRDNNLGYSPENCRVVVRAINNRNKRSNRYYTAFGESKCLFDWGKDSRCIVGMFCLRGRADNGLWEGRFEEAMITPPQDRKTISSHKKNNINITAFGETKCISDWYADERCLIGLDVLTSRIKDGWEGEKAMTYPARSRRSVIIVSWGEEKTLKEWLQDERCLVKIDGLRSRIREGWRPELAISTPSLTGVKNK